MEVLHIGDHDPSGVHIFSSLAEDIQAFVPEDDEQDLLLHPPSRDAGADQGASDLPTAPPKATATTAASKGLTTQAEALPPYVLVHIVGEAIKARVDEGKRRLVLAAERAGRKQLAALLPRIDPGLSDNP